MEVDGTLIDNLQKMKTVPRERVNRVVERESGWKRGRRVVGE